MKAPDVKFFFGPHGALRAPKVQAPRGTLGACPPQEIFKIEHLETPFPLFLNLLGRAGVYSSSL